MDERDFVIPLDKDELARKYFDDYGNREVVPLQMLARELNEISLQRLSEAGPVELVSEKQDVFLSAIIYGNKVELAVLIRAFNKILKIIQNLVLSMEKIVDQTNDLEFEQSDKSKMLYTNKFLAYALSSILCTIEDLMADVNSNNVGNTGKRKKNSQRSDVEEEWDDQREKALELIFRWLQLPLKSLWTPPIVEDMFVGTLSQICYKILEKTKDFKSKNMKNLIFQILGILVKRYNHGIACVVRIIQLARFHEALGAPIGAGVVLMIKDYGCTGLMREIAREIGESEPGEADARNYCNFLESVANSQADVVLPIIDTIIDYLANDCYVMRNCAISVMGLIVANILTGENLSPEKRALRDECLDSLEEHILDYNAYVRSKVLQTWQKLCSEGAIPLTRQNCLLKAAVLRLEDKSANVRKQALILLRAILQGNPFASKMNREKFSQDLENNKAKLKQLQTEIYHFVGAEEEKEELWKTQLPLIEDAINQVTEEEKDDDAEEKENDEEVEEIDIKETFNKIQHYILRDKCSKAVKYLKKLFVQSGFAKELNNVSEETKKEALLLFMYKIFMNSSSKENGEDPEKNKKSLMTTDQEELKKLDQIKVIKKLVEYLENCLTFVAELEKIIPTVEKLLYSVNPGDAIEACAFLGAAYQFQIAGALSGVRKALFQIFCRDQSVRDNVACVYKEIYLDHMGNQISARQKALHSVKSLIQLLDGLQSGQSTALAKLVISWRSSSDLDAEALKVMWEMFSLKLANTTHEESRAALMLLTMASQAESNIVTDNLDVLIKVGLGPRANTDLLLARDTCRAFLAINQDCSKDIDKSPIRYTNDHEIFTQVCTLLKESFFEELENGYTSYATDAVNVIYHLADQPTELMEEVLAHIGNVGKFIRTSRNSDASIEISSFRISRFLYLIGHVGIREMVHLDQSVYKELKRRNAVREKKKEIRARLSSAGRRKSLNTSTMSTVSNASSVMGSARRSIRRDKNDDENEDGMEGATADDADAEHINMVLEEELLAEDSYLQSFTPLILDVCQHPEKYNDEVVQGHGVLALTKFMTISSSFCEANLQLLVTILERSSYPQIRANILVGLADLMARFPNQIEPWTSHIYGRLKDKSLVVRSTCVSMLSNLILGEMIRVKGQVAQLALCMIDDNETIRSHAKQLFKDLSQKGNALYNVMPDILSCLSDSELKLAEKDFQEIIKYILGLLQKDRQVDSIIEKLCSRFKLATTERQWRDLSYCLSLLKFSAKGIRILINDLPLLKEKIHNEDVQKALNCIVENAKRRPEAKTACAELEEKIKELLDSEENNEDGAAKPISDSEAMPPPSRSVPRTAKSKKKTRRRRRKEEEEEEEEDVDNDDDDDDEDVSNSTRSQSSNNSRRARTRSISNRNSESEEDNIFKTPQRPAKRVSARTPSHNKDTLEITTTPLKKREAVLSTPSPSISSRKRTRISRN